MLTIKEMIPDPANINVTTLAALSDKLWELGNLRKIREKASPDLFDLHISINMVGNWKAGGWWHIICEQADLVPYIPAALDQLNLPRLKTALADLIKIFPEFTVFQSNDSTYCDIVNFLQNTHFKVQDERLKSITPEKRREMVMQIRQKLDQLENLTEPIWGECSECNGWQSIFDFVLCNAAFPGQNSGEAE